MSKISPLSAEPALVFLRRGEITTSPQLFGTGARCFLPMVDDDEDFTVASPSSCTMVSSANTGDRSSLLGTREELAESLLRKVARGCRWG
jgi:hypothetical protein